MPALASTEDKALLRYLYLRELSISSDNIGSQKLLDVLEELRFLDRKYDYRFGFEMYCYIESESLHSALGILSDLYLIEYENSTDLIRLTMLGRIFAQNLRFGSFELEDILQTYFYQGDKN